MKVNIEDIETALALLSSLNRVDVRTIKWFRNGEPVFFDPAIVEEFAFTGLNNSDLLWFVNEDEDEGVNRLL